MKQRNLPDCFSVSYCRVHGRPDSWRSKSNRRSVPDLSWATFRRATSLPLSLCLSFISYSRASVDITETRRGIWNRSSHLSQTSTSHDTSRLSTDNRFISSRRLEFLLETEPTFLYTSRPSWNAGRTLEHIVTFSFSPFLDFFSFEIITDSFRRVTPPPTHNETCPLFIAFSAVIAFWKGIRTGHETDLFSKE